jgi:hypothetical protein
MRDALAIVGREPERVVNYIRSLSGFEECNQIDGNYGHVGAILADLRAAVSSWAHFVLLRKEVTPFEKGLSGHGTSRQPSGYFRL